MAKKKKSSLPPKNIIRNKGTRKPRYILIVSEGSRTEPNYFKGFSRDPEKLKIHIVGTGYNTITLVEEAIKLKEQAPKWQKYAQVWVVFDKDSFPEQNYNYAHVLAQSNQIKVASTNEAFELWYLLHFDQHTSALSRTAYGKKLSDRLHFKYKKNSEEMYSILRSRQPTAIKNANYLESFHNPSTPQAKRNPCTTVHHLVEALNEFLI